MSRTAIMTAHITTFGVVVLTRIAGIIMLATIAKGRIHCLRLFAFNGRKGMSSGYIAAEKYRKYQKGENQTHGHIYSIA
ncbi:MAG: hypothetical protein WBK55_08510 [Alphaproteobacteria bacterium]